jgi:uncharacterized protein
MTQFSPEMPEIHYWLFGQQSHLIRGGYAAIMVHTVIQRLRILPGEYVIEHYPRTLDPALDTDWLTFVRAPEGLTVVRRVATDEAVTERWSAFYSGQTAHDLDVPGMLAAVVEPLAQAALSVFVSSTYHADIVLVQAERLSEAADVLRGVGHIIEHPADTQL